MQLSIIIVNFNVKYFLEQCLYSVFQAIKELQAEVFVVDNNSSDGSRDLLEGAFPDVNFIWNTENSGFAKANNIALKRVSGEYILFLNPDTLVPEDCFLKCIAFMRSQEDRCALGIHMLDGAGNFLKESKRSFPSPLTSLYKLSGLSSLFPHSKIFGSYHLGNLDENANHEIDVLAGAFMMIPAKIIERVGAFDEQFFMYGEDVDLSYRIQEAGFKNYYFSESNIIHFKGESTRKGSLNYVRLFYKAMILFVRKHYGGTKAGVFNLSIQIAIIIRGLISALGQFIRWVGMPVLDAGIILLSFGIIKTFWNHFIKREVIYSHSLLITALPVFSLVFLITSYYLGLYDNGYRQRQLNRVTLISLLILLSGYSLLPETLRFSRGILVFGTLLAFILISISRALLVHWQVIESSDEDDEHRQTVIVGTEKEFLAARELMMEAGMEERVLGRVEVMDNSDGSAVGTIRQLGALIKMYPIREVVFCQGKLTFATIIETLNQIPSHTRIKFHAASSNSIIGSDSKDVSGKIISANKAMKLSLPINRRNKRSIAIVIALVFLMTFPVHLITQKNRVRFFRNVIMVLFLRGEWVGYAASVEGLPMIRQGVLTTTGLPPKFNSLPLQSLESTDIWYATTYNVLEDIKLIWRGYQYLGT